MCVYFSVRPHTELSYGSPRARRIIHEAVTLGYASIKLHLQPAGAKMEQRERVRKPWDERKDGGRTRKIEDGGRETETMEMRNGRPRTWLE